ncbi:MAG: hypothetical protein K2K27_07750 [Muribaculaceae bacterium]|nr:hypothetical protein [Muribaculaceae bacterium]
MGKFDIPGVTKTSFASIQDGEEWSQQVQKSEWFKSRLFINKIEIVLWIRLALFVLEKQIRASKFANIFANDGVFKNDAIKTGSIKDFIVEAGGQEEKHRRNMQEADLEVHKELIKEQKAETASMSFLFFALKNSVKYSYYIINGLVLTFIIWAICHNYQRSQLLAEEHSTANTDIAPAWYEQGQKTYESILQDCKVGTRVLQFKGEMRNGYRFDMTLCLDGKNTIGAYVYNDLEQINRNLPKAANQDYYSENAPSSNYTCAALMLKGDLKGDISAPGKKISVNLTEYDINNHKVGSFKGQGVVESKNSSIYLTIEGIFKSHSGQKIRFDMSLYNSIEVESFTEIANGLLSRKSIKKILYISDNENPFAIVVNNHDNIVMLKYSGLLTDYDIKVQDATPNFGYYYADKVIEGDDYIIMKDQCNSISYSNGVDNYIPTEKIRILDLKENALRDTTINGVIWDNDIWESNKVFYTVKSEDSPVIITGYNKYGKVISDITLPIFHAYIPTPGIIIGEMWGDAPEGDFHQPVFTKVFDFNGNEIEDFTPVEVKRYSPYDDEDVTEVIAGD